MLVQETEELKRSGFQQAVTKGVLGKASAGQVGGAGGILCKADGQGVWEACRLQTCWAGWCSAWIDASLGTDQPCTEPSAI